MPAKKTTLKKTKAIAAAFDSALKKDTVPVEPIDNNIIEDEDFNEFSPENKTNNDWAEDLNPEQIVIVEKEYPELIVAQQKVKDYLSEIKDPRQNETPSDALIVERLINAINYLAPIANKTKGILGPNPQFINRISINIAHARLLIEKLKC